MVMLAEGSFIRMPRIAPPWLERRGWKWSKCHGLLTETWGKPHAEVILACAIGVVTRLARRLAYSTVGGATRRSSLGGMGARRMMAGGGEDFAKSGDW